MKSKKGDKIRLRILGIKNSLKGKAEDGRKLNIITEFRPLRYFLTLYFALNSIVFEEYAKSVGVKRFFNFYRIKKIGNNILNLEIDTTRMCRKIFDDGEKKGMVKMIEDENRTYISLTARGERKCEDWIDEIEQIQKYQVLLREANTMKLKMDKGLSDMDKYRKLRRQQLLELISRIEKISREIG